MHESETLEDEAQWLPSATALCYILMGIGAEMF